MTKLKFTVFLLAAGIMTTGCKNTETSISEKIVSVYNEENASSESFSNVSTSYESSKDKEAKETNEKTSSSLGYSSESESAESSEEKETKATNEETSFQETTTQAADNPENVPTETESFSEIQTTAYSTAETSETSYPAEVSYDKEFFNNDLFIGDSITTGFYLYNKLDMRNVAAAVGYTPYKAWHNPVDLYDGTSATALEYAAAMQPERIYIMLGSNGLLNLPLMKTSYPEFLDELIAACPDSAVYCMSVPPITYDSSAAAYSGITNQMALDLNDYIKNTICVDYNLEYLDICTLLSDSDGYFSHDYAEADGMHFKGAAYDVVLDYIENAVSG